MTAAFFAFVALGSLIYAYVQQETAKENLELAQHYELVAQKNAEEAIRQAKIAKEAVVERNRVTEITGRGRE